MRFIFKMKPINCFNPKSLPVIIGFWILFFFLIRMIGITNPPLEIGHNWRQTTGLMVARNFMEVDPNILYPRIDATEGDTGIIGMEFPLLSYLHFIIAKLLGYSHWYGRLINLFVSSLGVFFFYKILERFFNQKVALYSSLFLLSSIWFAFSRKTMPDTFSASIAIIGLYYGIDYLLSGRLKNLSLYAILTTLAILAKIPAVIFLVIILLPFFNRLIDWRRKLHITMITILPVALTFLWYFVWNPYLAETYGYWYNSGKDIGIGYMEIMQNIGETLQNFYFSAFQGYLVFVISLAGLILAIIKRNWILLTVFGLLFLVFVGYILKSGFFFYHHNYYIIPFVPVLALLAGYYISSIKIRWLAVLLISIGIAESVANQQHELFIKSSEKYKLDLEEIADIFSSRDDLIAINGDGNPQQLYLSHRKGWVINSNQLMNMEYIESIRSKGCKYLIINKNYYKQKMEIDWNVVYEDSNFIAYSLLME
jgi:hypothetical protein